MTSAPLIVLLALGVPPMPPRPPAPPEIVTPLDPSPLAARKDDAAIDQAWLSPTALTQPAGTVTVESRDLFLLTATWAIHDRLQLTAGGVPWFGGEWLLGATAKLRLIDASHFQGAVIAGGGARSADDRHSIVALGAVGTFCASVSCRTTVSVHTVTNFDWNRTFLQYVYGGSVIVMLGRPCKLVAEVNFAGQQYEGLESYRSGHFKGLVGTLGFRIHMGRVAGLIGVMIVYGRAEPTVSSESRDVVVPLPAVSLGWRFGR